MNNKTNNAITWQELASKYGITDGDCRRYAKTEAQAMLVVGLTAFYYGIKHGDAIKATAKKAKAVARHYIRKIRAKIDEAVVIDQIERSPAVSITSLDRPAKEAVKVEQAAPKPSAPEDDDPWM